MTAPAVIFVNGPPRAGKDTLANHLCGGFVGFRNVKLSGVLKERTHALYGLVHDGRPLPHDHFEACKDVELPSFMGLTPRAAYIGASERYWKPLHGDDVFGRLLVRDMERGLWTRGFVVSDSGFAAEAAPIVERFGAANCLLIRVHAEGRGCTFAGDSRSFIGLRGVATADLWNDGTDPTAFLSEAERRVAQFLTHRA